jgi:hypothetical protein
MRVTFSVVRRSVSGRGLLPPRGGCRTIIGERPAGCRQAHCGCALARTGLARAAIAGQWPLPGGHIEQHSVLSHSHVTTETFGPFEPKLMVNRHMATGVVHHQVRGRI